MRTRVSALVALAFGIALSSAPPAEPCAADDAKPLPVDKTGILKSGGTYYVEGRVRVPKGVELTVQKETKIVARGTDAVIEVVGELVVRGVRGGSVLLEGVTIEPQKEFEGLRTETTVFTGGSRGIVSPKDTPVNGRLVALDTTFEAGATFDVTIASDDIDLQSVHCTSPVRIKGVAPEGATANKSKLMVLNNKGGTASGTRGGFTAGILVESVGDVTIRCNEISGEKATFIDCPSLTFDANWVRCKTLEMKQAAAGNFGRTLISKCDFQCEKIVLYAPAAPGKAESIPCDKCWFGGEVKEKAVREKFFTDREDDPGCSVAIDLKKIMEKPLNLAGTVSR
jgi:hypothetical protein